MAGGIYLVRGESELVEMTETPFENEDLFQKLLAQFPRILGGDQLDGFSSKRWLLVSREAGIPDIEDGADRWSVDHLFVDEEAIPTFVEVKRKSDTRLRREVVGQMLDYVSHAVTTWSKGRIRTVFEKQCGGDDPVAVLAEGLEDDIDADAFRSDVDTNLKAGKIRLVFVADLFPPELRRVVEFLNVQMSPAEVLGIEIRQYVGEGLQTLVPHVIGRTIPTTGSRERWDRDRFFAAVAVSADRDEIRIAEKLLSYAQSLTERDAEWGSGKERGSFTARLTVNGQRFSVFSVYTTGQFSLNMGWGYSSRTERRTEMAERFRLLAKERLGLDFGENVWVNGWPMAPLSLLGAHMDAFKKLTGEFVSDARELASSDPSD